MATITNVRGCPKAFHLASGYTHLLRAGESTDKPLANSECAVLAAWVKMGQVSIEPDAEEPEALETEKVKGSKKGS